MLRYIILALTFIAVYSIECDSGEFAEFDDPCTACSDANTCTECKTGYYLDTNAAC